jgi:hypothetical protein
MNSSVVNGSTYSWCVRYTEFLVWCMSTATSRWWPIVLLATSFRWVYLKLIGVPINIFPAVQTSDVWSESFVRCKLGICLWLLSSSWMWAMQGQGGRCVHVGPRLSVLCLGRRVGMLGLYHTGSSFLLLWDYMSAHLMLRCCSAIGCFFGDLKSKQEGKGPSGEKREYVPPVNRPGCQCNYASFFTHCCVHVFS